jgi:hypothetical protein
MWQGFFHLLGTFMLLCPEKLVEIYKEAQGLQKDVSIPLELRLAFVDLEIAARKAEIELIIHCRKTAGEET